MTTMSDKAAQDIAKKIVKKYEDAGHSALIILKDKSDSGSAVSNMTTEDAVEAALNLIYEITGDDTEAIFKDAAKQAKQLKKARKDDSKRKNRA